MESAGKTPITLQDLFIVGGGHAHVYVIKMLAMSPPQPHLRITVISRDLMSPYSGMIPGYIAGYYTKEECHIDLFKLCSFAKARFIHSEVVNIDTEKRLIYCRDISTDPNSTYLRPPLKYDVLSIDIGIIPRPLPIKDPYMIKNITSVKPIDKFATRWEIALHKILSETLSLFINTTNFSESKVKLRTVAIVGGGGGGTELAFAINHRLKSFLCRNGVPQDVVKMLVEVVLFNKSSIVMESHSK